LRRYRTDIRAMRLALNILKEKPLLVFPQGTRSRDLDESLAGVGFLAKKAGVPVVAARIEGTDKILPPGRKLPRFYQLRVVFGRVANIEKTDSYRQITARVVATVQTL